MYYILLTLICIATQVNSYVLLQVRKDDQNRSNVDALIHKVLPSGQFDEFAKKIARKQFSNQKTKETVEPETVTNSDSKEDVKIKDAIMKFMDKKPVFRTKDFNIKPQVINLRSNPASLMYEVDSNVIVKVLQDFLSSKLVSQYTDDVAKKAATIFRSFRKNFD